MIRLGGRAWAVEQGRWLRAMLGGGAWAVGGGGACVCMQLGRLVVPRVWIRVGVTGCVLPGKGPPRHGSVYVDGVCGPAGNGLNGRRRTPTLSAAEAEGRTHFGAQAPSLCLVLRLHV